MSRQIRSTSGSGILKFPHTVVIDFYSRWLDRVDSNHIELVLGQVIFGVIQNSVLRQYGRLVEYFVNIDDSTTRTLNDKMKYIDDLFECCHANTRHLQISLSPYKDLDFQIENVSFNKADHYATFTLTEGQPINHLRRPADLRAVRR